MLSIHMKFAHLFEWEITNITQCIFHFIVLSLTTYREQVCCWTPLDVNKTISRLKLQSHKCIVKSFSIFHFYYTYKWKWEPMHCVGFCSQKLKFSLLTQLEKDVDDNLIRHKIFIRFESELKFNVLYLVVLAMSEIFLISSISCVLYISQYILSYYFFVEKVNYASKTVKTTLSLELYDVWFSNIFFFIFTDARKNLNTEFKPENKIS